MTLLCRFLLSFLTPFDRDNSWRKGILTICLKLLCPNPELKYEVTEQERKYLIQFAALADQNLPPLIPSATQPFYGAIVELGRSLQKTSIGLEGVEESTLQLSFQQSRCHKDIKTRSHIEALKVREGSQIPDLLFKNVIDLYPIEHDEGQQAIARAVEHCLATQQSKTVKKWLDTELNDVRGELINPMIDPKTLILPRAIFIADLYLLLHPDEKLITQQIASFNEKLIESKNAPQMLLGLAREITRYSSSFKQEPAVELLGQLLRLKIGYQQIKKTYFDGKVELRGSLKMAVDRAEWAMVESIEQLLRMVKQRAIDVSALSTILLQPKDPKNKGFLEKNVEKTFKQQIKQGLPFTIQPPFFLSFGKTDIDMCSGTIYFDGEEQQELPPSIRNHPHLRLLHFHDLPYVFNHEDGSFTYYTIDDDKKIAQIRLVMEEGNNLIIQRRLNTKFSPDKELKQLQYLPFESFDVIPTGLQQMGAQEFWIDRRKTIYGYNNKGTLLFAIQRNQIHTPTGTFLFPSAIPEEGRREDLIAIVSHLENIVPLDEILIKTDQQTVFIPVLKLTLTLNNQRWYAQGAHVDGMILDVNSTPASSLFTFKWDDLCPASSRPLRNHLIILNKRLQEAMSKEEPSMFHKEEIKEYRNQIVETNNKLTQLDRRLHLFILPSQDNLSQLRKKINHSLYELTEFFTKLDENTYLHKEKLLHEMQQDYNRLCVEDRSICFETSYPEHVKGRDLTSSLFLITQSLQQDEQFNSKAWIEELSQYPLKEPFNTKTCQLIDRALNVSDELGTDNLSLYLSLLFCHHSFLLIEEKKKNITHDQIDALTAFKKEYDRWQQKIETFDLDRVFPCSISSLLHFHCPHHFRHDSLPVVGVAKSCHPSTVEELMSYSSQSLLERLFIVDMIEHRPKDLATFVLTNQQKLIKEFRATSRDQVGGFFFRRVWDVFSTSPY